MNIVFYGLYKSFDYYQIGGMDSLARRLGGELTRTGHEVSFVHFGCPLELSGTTPEGIRLYYFVRFEDALKYLSHGVQHVIAIYIPPKDRLTWILFRRSQNNRIKFHKYYSGWSESWIKRRLGFIDARIFPYNGTLFCASPRLKNEVSRWADRIALMLPPVPKEYFLDIGSKERSISLRVTFMGRIDSKKGAGKVVDFFKYLAEKAPDIKTVISGYHRKDDPESVKFHKELSHQKDICYVPVEVEGYSLEVEEVARGLLRETDILFLPYDRLSSTVDTPLLLLEGMAHLCVVVTRPLGSMPEVYGSKEYMLKDFVDHKECLRLLRNAQTRLGDERACLAERCGKLSFNSVNVANTLVSRIVC